MTGAYVGIGADVTKFNLGIFSRSIQKRFYLTPDEIYSLQRGLMSVTIMTDYAPNGELRGVVEMTSCATTLVSIAGSPLNTAFAQVFLSTGGNTALSAFVQNATDLNTASPFTAGNDARLSLGQEIVLGESPVLDHVVKVQHSDILMGLVPGTLFVRNLVANTPVAVGKFSMKIISDPAVYIVQAGDTLDGIAKSVGMESFVTLQMLNRLPTPDLIVPGQSINTCYMHTVHEGESLYSIATKYGRTYQELLPFNPDLFDIGYLYVGQKICVQPALRRFLCGWPSEHAIARDAASA
jgi:LysM repeat protein